MPFQFSKVVKQQVRQTGCDRHALRYRIRQKQIASCLPSEQHEERFFTFGRPDISIDNRAVFKVESAGAFAVAQHECARFLIELQHLNQVQDIDLVELPTEADS